MNRVLKINTHKLNMGGGDKELFWQFEFEAVFDIKKEIKLFVLFHCKKLFSKDITLAYRKGKNVLNVCS